jgi:hypothetical protein
MININRQFHIDSLKSKIAIDNGYKIERILQSESNELEALIERYKTR